jgi:hypothetical protein
MSNIALHGIGVHARLPVSFGVRPGVITMIDFTEITYDSDDWELFARDFLAEIGFTIESPPDRGPDQGKDMLVLETVSGKLHHYTFRWLVSCKHFATSGKAVNESKDEPNILERMRAFQAGSSASTRPSRHQA